MKKQIPAALALSFVVSTFAAVNSSTAQNFNAPNPLLQQNHPQIQQQQQQWQQHKEQKQQQWQGQKAQWQEHQQQKQQNIQEHKAQWQEHKQQNKPQWKPQQPVNKTTTPDSN